MYKYIGRIVQKVTQSVVKEVGNQLSKSIVKKTVSNVSKKASQEATKKLVVSTAKGLGVAGAIAIGHQTGIDKGHHAGYNAASKIYEEKFQKQAEAFLKQEKSAKENYAEYQALISDMQKEIIRLENELKSTKADKEHIEKELKKLKGKVADLKKLKRPEA